MAGVDAKTGKLLNPWPAAVQRFETILTTRKGTRVMARAVGSDAAALQDAPVSPVTAVDFYAAIAEAADQEPCIKVGKMTLVATGDPNRPAIDVAITYYPRGHLGDFSTSQDKTMRVTI